MSNNFNTYRGKFTCRTCKKEVGSIRVYSNGVGSWMCQDKHITEVEIFQVGYKKKKDYERKERE